jgi:hypothetical protein
MASASTGHALEASPRSVFSSDFIIRSSGRTITTLDMSVWRERAEFELDGATYHMYREGLLVGDFVLDRGGAAIGRATKPSVLRSRFELHVGGYPLELRRTAWFSQRFGLYRGTEQIGMIRPARLFSRRVLVDLPAEIPLSLQIFTLWLALVMWRRQQRAAAS